MPTQQLLSQNFKIHFNRRLTRCFNVYPHSIAVSGNSSQRYCFVNAWINQPFLSQSQVGFKLPHFSTPANMEEDCCQCKVPDLHGISGGVLCYGCGNPPQPLEGGDPDSLDKSYRKASCFRHKPLVKSSDFRLVRLFPGQSQSPIVCHVLRFALEEHPRYEAVSYTWGNQESPKQIFTQSGSLSVTPSCHAALSDLRYSEEDRYLWIDAVCINQSDNREKNHQIPLMKRIYAEADRVLIHLRNVFQLDARRFFTALELLQPLDLPDGQIITSQFLSEPWFSRAWVLQEASAARSALVIMGANAIDWSYISAGRLQALGVRAVNWEDRIPPALLNKERKPLRDLPSLLNVARSCSCTDPRDRIYALMGLLRNSADLHLAADYNKPAEDVYSEVTVQVIMSYNHLDILTEASDLPHLLYDAIHDAVESFTSMHELRRISQPREVPAEDRILADSMQRFLGVEAWVYTVQRMSHSQATQEQARWIAKLQDEWKHLKTTITEVSEEPIPGINYFPWRQQEDAPLPTFYSLLEVSTMAEEIVFGANVLHSSFLALCSIESTEPQRGATRLTVLFNDRIRLLPRVVRLLIRDALYFHYMAVEKIQEEIRASKKIALPFEMIGLGLDDLAKWKSAMREEQVLRLPSWVPDFRTHPALPSLANWRPNRAQGTGIPLEISRAGDVGTLPVKVLKLDSIVDCALPDGPLDSDKLEWKDSTGETISHNSHSFYQMFSSTFDQSHYGRLFADVWDFRQGRRFFPTGRSFAIAPISASVSDGIYFLYGANVPFVLRVVPDRDGAFQLLGECYLHGCRGASFGEDYLELLGSYKQCFSASAIEDLPWEIAHLV